MTSKSLMKQTRRLTQALFISGALNIILFTILGYVLLNDKGITHHIEQRPIATTNFEERLGVDFCNGDLIRRFRSLPYEKLILNLQDSRLVENGYTQRDLALAALAAFHHFDIARALKGTGQPLQKRLITYGRQVNGKPAQVVAFPCLTDVHFKAILDFAKTEKWPQTSQGLFFILRKKTNPDDTLADAFYLTPEFAAVETLFKRSGICVDKSELLAVVLQGTWRSLSRFTDQQKIAQDLSAVNRQHFLLEYIKLGSKAAAYLMLKTDGAFASKRLDDETILSILKLLETPLPEAEKFAQDLLTSPRSDAVWELAGERLCGYAGEPKPENPLQHASLARCVSRASAAKPVAQELSMERTYVVQNGDNLWKIARRFQVDVDTIRIHNKIEGDFLHPGNILKIPSI